MDPICRRQAIEGLASTMVLSAVGMAPAAAGEFAPIDAFIDKIVTEGLVAGAAVSIECKGEPIYARARGSAGFDPQRPLDLDAIWRVYSMTKPVTACAVLLLVDDGVLGLDDPVGKWVPELADMRVHVEGSGVAMKTVPVRMMTVRHLLTHTSGLTNSWNGDAVSPLYVEAGLTSGAWFHDPKIQGLEDYAARLGGLPLVFQPGTRWKYSISPDIAGLVVQRAAGQPFGAFLSERLFGPLGMGDTGFHIPEDKAHRLTDVYLLNAEGRLALAEAAKNSPYLHPPSGESGAAGLVSSLADYSRFAQMIANGGHVGGVKILSEAAVDELCTSQVPPEVLGDSLVEYARFGSGSVGEGTGMGLCGSVVLDPAVSGVPGRVGDYSWGGAASTTFFASPASGVSAVFMTQLWPSGTHPFLAWLKKAVHEAIG